jgi:amino acid adenylation domain-containing protein
VHGDQALTYQQMYTASGWFASWFADRGVRAGDRLVLLLPNSAVAAAAFFGAARLGAVAVFANVALADDQVAHIVRHSGAAAIVTDSRRQRQATAAAGPVQLLLADAWAPSVTDAGPQPSAGPISLDLAALIYTSGSTGPAKGVMVTHANLIAGARIVADYLHLGEADRTLSVLPWSFDAGLNQLLATFWAGGTLVIPASHHPHRLGRQLAEAHITGLAGVPTLWEMLVSRAGAFLDLDLPDLRYLTNTGGPMRGSTLRRIRSSHPGTDIYLMYGLTEAFRSTYLPPVLVDSHPDSMGVPIPDTQISVLDDEGRVCEAGEVGELVHRGPTVASGYWRDPVATERVFRPHADGSGERVVHSGDYVRRGEAGLLTYVGRRDEQFKSRGFRVNPSEIESVLMSSGLVSAAVVFPADTAPDPEIVAVVVPADDGQHTVERLRAYCRPRLPAHHQPAVLTVRSSLPHTTSGKVDRARVRADHQVTRDSQ